MAAAENRMFAKVNSPPTAPPTAPPAQQAAPAAQARSGPIALPILGRYSSLSPSWLSKGIAGTALTLLFYTSITVFILFLVLVFIHYTMYPIFSFSADEEGIISIPTASEQQNAFHGVVATSDMSANIVAISDTNYTVSFDVYLSGDFFVTKAPRTLLYRAATRVVVGSDDTVTNILTKYSDSNILLWVDPEKNDLFVSAMTSSNGGPKGIETLPTPVKNIPIRKVFRLTVVYTDRFMEVYINGRLETSMPLRGKPVSQAASHAFFPPPSHVSGSVKVANMSFWPRPLRAREVKSLAGTPMADAPLFSPQVSS